jgi:hypothetical protein
VSGTLTQRIIAAPSPPELPSLRMSAPLDRPPHRPKRCSRPFSKTSRTGERLSTSSAWSLVTGRTELARRRRAAARTEGSVSAGVRFRHGRKNLGDGQTMSCGRPPGRLRRFFFRLAARRQKRCGDLFLEEPPPDSFVAEPRRPKPQAPGGSVALEIPPEWRSL